MNALEKLKMALTNNQLKEYLLGNGIYKIPSREGYYTDRSTVLYSGIYKYFQLYPNSNINIYFQNELRNMLNGNEFEVLTCFDYLWDQLIAEEKNIAPFEIEKSLYVELKKCVEKNREKLKEYKFFDFGLDLKEGALQYITNISNNINENYGHKIL